MKRDDKLKRSAEIRQYILAQVAKNPSGITASIVEKFKISRQAATRYLKQMVQDGQLTAVGTTKDRVYKPGVSTSTKIQYDSLTPQSILETINDQKDFLQDHGVKKLGLFGSYARGEASADSDLDFLVELQEPSFDAYMDVKFFLEDTFHHEVDLVLSNQVKPRLRENILREVQYATGL
jgi:predicted nucleotidyltransferase